MNKFTNSTPTLQPLSIDDLRNTVGGDGDAVNPESLLGPNGVVVEDLVAFPKNRTA